VTDQPSDAARNLVLLDAYSLAYRAFFALPADMATRTGTFTNAVFGFTSMLVKLLADERPDAVAVVWDAPGGSDSRKAIDDQYKATRNATPELFSAQVPLIREVLDTIGIPMVTCPGVEADDAIATIADRAATEGWKVTIVTGDRDSYQLVRDPGIEVLYNRRGVSDYARYDEAGILERTGVRPDQYVEYAAMRGDNSDNLPGVPGVGEKTAAKLVQTYGGIDGVMEHLAELTPKLRATLPEHADRVRRNRQLMTLRRDCEVEVEIAELVPRDFDREEARAVFDRLEFRTLYPRLLEALPAVGGAEAAVVAEPAAAVETIALADADAVRAFVVAADRPVALEGRWSGRVAGNGDLLGLALAVVPEPGGDIGPVHLVGEPLLGAFVAAATEAGWFEGRGPGIVAHLAKQLARALGKVAGSFEPGACGWPLLADTAVEAWLLDPGASSYPLEEVAVRYLGIELSAAPAGTLDLLGTLDLEADDGAAEAGRRAAAVAQLVEPLREALEAQELEQLWREVELPLVGVLARMEEAGILVDLDFLHGLAAELTKERDELEAKVHEHAGEPFNVNSTQQLATIIFDKLGLASGKKTKTGRSTAAAELEKLRDLHPIIGDLLRYREVEKLRGTYADAFIPLVQADGRIRARFNQTATATGRIGSEQPNIQNIPVRSPDGRELRRAFIAPPGWQLLVADYSQIEMRVLAHLADDPGLIDAFTRGTDVHLATAARVYAVMEDDVTSAQRRFAKVVNYGLAYGMEAYGLAQRAGVEVEEAKAVLDAYFAGFPRVAAYMDEVVQEARDRGYTTTLMGRRRRLPELASPNFRIRQMGERMAKNAPVQGSAADIFKVAMVRLDAALAERRMRSRLLLTVHDELVLEVPDDEADDAVALVRTTMEDAATLTVPLVVDAGLGRTWADAKH
jgi:DNA polymerase I